MGKICSVISTSFSFWCLSSLSFVSTSLLKSHMKTSLDICAWYTFSNWPYYNAFLHNRFLKIYIFAYLLKIMNVVINIWKVQLIIAFYLTCRHWVLHSCGNSYCPSWSLTPILHDFHFPWNCMIMVVKLEAANIIFKCVPGWSDWEGVPEKRNLLFQGCGPSLPKPLAPVETFVPQ